jgi:hypothetical protein
MHDRRHGVRTSDLIEPLLNAAEMDDMRLRHAINLVAEAMAALNVTFQDERGRPVPGVTDEMAVLALLQLHYRELAGVGRLDEAVAVTELADRIDGLEP